MIDNLKAAGKIHITVKNMYDQVKSETVVSNKIVNTGINHIVENLLGNTQPVFSHIGFGNNSVTAVATDTALFDETFRLPLSEINTSNNIITYRVSMAPNEPGSNVIISEVGLFNANTAGTMFARAGFAPIVKTTTDSLVVAWIITIQAGN